ncbi:dTMP kinase [Aestuariimicrobium sp. Y1814]|uniref:dTMP kinase n=1 Tax=Aestuariimicrobium sp. Y1814 TaxID=3418742 RepID=UPI003DA78069
MNGQRRSSRAPFIVFEGIDGSGKSTQVQHLADRLVSLGHRVHVTAEPTSSLIGSLIRNAFSGRVSMDDRTIAALFAADRLDHLTNDADGVLGLLDAGIIVISDRYHLSSHAYHGGDVGSDWVEAANSVSTNLLRPDLTIFLDVHPSLAIRRIETSRIVHDRFEKLSRLEAARANYYEAIQQFRAADNVRIISATDSVLDIAEAVWVQWEQIWG